MPAGEVQADRLGRARPVKHQETRVMLTALGVWADGHWAILPWHLAHEEDASAWGTLLGILSTKDITEATTQLMVSDGAPGLEKAL